MTIKRPDVWTENRLYTYRREFEDVFHDTKALRDFKPTLSASQSAVQTERLGMALSAALEVERVRAEQGPGLGQFLSLAVLENFKFGKEISEQDFGKILQTGAKAFIAAQTGLDPTMVALAAKATEGGTGGDGGTGDDGTGGDGAADDSDEGEGDADTGGASTGGAGAPAAKGSNGGAPAAKGDEKAKFPDFDWWLTKANIPKLFDLPDATQVEGTINLLSPFEIQNQKRAFVNQNHLFRIGNEPDDGTRMNGYRLYYMRYMISVTPSGKTDEGHSAEILLSPKYDVLDAARDWVAQYARGMLRERIMREVEFGFEKAIGEHLSEYGRNLPDFKAKQDIEEHFAAMKEDYAAAKEAYDEKDCDKFKKHGERVNKRLAKLRELLGSFKQSRRFVVLERISEKWGISTTLALRNARLPDC